MYIYKGDSKLDKPLPSPLPHRISPCVLTLNNKKKFPNDGTNYYGGPITAYSDKFPHDRTKYYGDPIIVCSDKFNVTSRDVTQHFLLAVPLLNYLETFGLYGLDVQDLTVAQQIFMLDEKNEIQKKKNSFFTKRRL